jgi:hypothetical protein
MIQERNENIVYVSHSRPFFPNFSHYHPLEGENFLRMKRHLLFYIHAFEETEQSLGAHPFSLVAPSWPFLPPLVCSCQIALNTLTVSGEHTCFPQKKSTW